MGVIRSSCGVGRETVFVTRAGPGVSPATQGITVRIRRIARIHPSDGVRATEDGSLEADLIHGLERISDSAATSIRKGDLISADVHVHDVTRVLELRNVPHSQV